MVSRWGQRLLGFVAFVFISVRCLTSSTAPWMWLSPDPPARTDVVLTALCRTCTEVGAIQKASEHLQRLKADNKSKEVDKTTGRPVSWTDTSRYHAAYQTSGNFREHLWYTYGNYDSFTLGCCHRYLCLYVKRGHHCGSTGHSGFHWLGEGFEHHY